jgi:hypothetical protein
MRSGKERFEKHRDAAHTLCVDLLAFGSDARSAYISRQRPPDSGKETRPVDGYR